MEFSCSRIGCGGNVAIGSVLRSSIRSSATRDCVQYSSYQRALQDIIDGIKKWPIWFMLAKHDLYLRYRRSFLGPVWLTLSVAITIYSMGFLYSFLFHTALEHYLPFLATGMVSWLFISNLLTNACQAFVSSSGYMREVKLPYTLYLHRVACRGLLTFFHNLIALIPIYFLFPQTVQLHVSFVLIIPGLFVIYINAISYGLILAILSARYRDVSQVVSSMMRVVFFLTPVMWDPAKLPHKMQLISQFNPFYAFIQLIRAPLLGMVPSMQHLVLVFMMTVLGFIASFILLNKYRTRIIYWL
jgi:lipopolysaccharide transport system permease protein